jgi:hypothetical protein
MSVISIFSSFISCPFLKISYSAAFLSLFFYLLSF